MISYSIMNSPPAFDVSPAQDGCRGAISRAVGGSPKRARWMTSESHARPWSVLCVYIYICIYIYIYVCVYIYICIYICIYIYAYIYIYMYMYIYIYMYGESSLIYGMIIYVIYVYIVSLSDIHNFDCQINIFLCVK